jgi:hypothetical protein
VVVLVVVGTVAGLVLGLRSRRRGRRARAAVAMGGRMVDVGGLLPSRLRDPETGEVL